MLVLGFSPYLPLTPSPWRTHRPARSAPAGCYCRSSCALCSVLPPLRPPSAPRSFRRWGLCRSRCCPAYPAHPARKGRRARRLLKAAAPLQLQEPLPSIVSKASSVVPRFLLMGVRCSPVSSYPLLRRAVNGQMRQTLAESFGKACKSRNILNARRAFRVAAPSIRIVPWAALASCWPLPQQLLPVSATGGGRRCCPNRGGLGKEGELYEMPRAPLLAGAVTQSVTGGLNHSRKGAAYV